MIVQNYFKYSKKLNIFLTNNMYLLVYIALSALLKQNVSQSTQAL